jgi:Esterase/lipase
MTREKTEKHEKRNKQLMKAIKAVHSIVEKSDLEKQRQSQNNIGNLLIANKEVNYESLYVSKIECEWVRIVQRHRNKYVILYCHGGGYFTGSLKYARSITSKMAIATGMDVLSFDYGLAPEQPYPKAIEDARQVWDYLLLKGYGSKNIIVAGDSAGGNLALVLLLRLKAYECIMPKALVLISPWTDLTLSGKSHETKAEVDPVLNKEYMDTAIKFYAEGEDLCTSDISPLFGEFEGFPPTYIQVGSNEILFHDAVSLQKQMQKVNVPVRLEIFNGMWHVFQMSPFKKAMEAMDKIGDFIFEICNL